MRTRKKFVEKVVKSALESIRYDDSFVGPVTLHLVGHKIKDGKTETWPGIRPARTRRGTKITTVIFEIGERYSYVDAITNNDIGIYAVTRRSNQDKHSPELAVRVLAGRLYHALEIYQLGMNVRTLGTGFTAIVPGKSMGMDKNMK